MILFIGRNLVNGAVALFFLLGLLIQPASAAVPDSGQNYRWIEFGPDNHIITRLITQAPGCPAGMMQHGVPPDASFPVISCQKVTVAPVDFYPRRIVIIGDTGCRIKKGASVQNCNNPHRWPFALIARHAAAWKPDLVIHVGDYLYRESHCPPHNAGCANSPHGDNWNAWNADFFAPAKPLLRAAPWIFVRGNHEICERGGEGWTRLLDPFNFKHCMNHSPLYPVNIGNDTRLFIMDSANASDFVAPAQQVEWFADYLRTLQQSHAAHNWLITHKPFWFVYDDAQLNRVLQNNIVNTLQNAWQEAAPANVELLLAGHIHRVQTLNFTARRPPQVIVGASGTMLDGVYKPVQLRGLSVIGSEVSEGLSLNQFAYMTLERKQKNLNPREAAVWLAQIRDPYGNILANCIFGEGREDRFLCSETWRGLRLEQTRRRS